MCSIVAVVVAAAAVVVVFEPVAEFVVLGITRHPLRAVVAVVVVDAAGVDIAVSSVAEAASFVPGVDVAAEPVELSCKELFDRQDY